MAKIDISAIARRYGLDKEKLAFADLLATGWSPKDAWAVVIRQGLQWPPQALKSAIESLDNNDGVKLRVRDVKLLLGGAEAIVRKDKRSSEVSLADSVSKETMLKELVDAKRDLDPGSNEWRDINKMIIDVTRMKQEEVKGEDTTVHFYLPAKDER